MTDPEVRRDALERYRRAKRDELHDEGPERLRMELAALEAWLARRARGDEWASREIEVDVEFREGKARILRQILEERRGSQSRG